MEEILLDAGIEVLGHLITGVTKEEESNESEREVKSKNDETKI